MDVERECSVIRLEIDHVDVERECSVIRDWRYIMWMWRGNFSVIRDWRYIMWRGNVALSETGDISCRCGEGM